MIMDISIRSIDGIFSLRRSQALEDSSPISISFKCVRPRRSLASELTTQIRGSVTLSWSWPSSPPNIGIVKPARSEDLNVPAMIANKNQKIIVHHQGRIPLVRSSVTVDV